jgi:hypothetical protein
MNTPEPRRKKLAERVRNTLGLGTEETTRRNAFANLGLVQLDDKTRGLARKAINNYNYNRPAEERLPIKAISVTAFNPAELTENVGPVLRMDDGRYLHQTQTGHLGDFRYQVIPPSLVIPNDSGRGVLLTHDGYNYAQMQLRMAPQQQPGPSQSRASSSRQQSEPGAPTYPPGIDLDRNRQLAEAAAQVEELVQQRRGRSARGR